MANIVTVPSEVLRKVATPIEGVNARVLKLLKDMDKVLRSAKDPQGVGLAAPQIGVSERIFMIRPETKGPITTFINPEIIKFSQKTINPHKKDGVYEGCLSIPKHYGPVKRAYSITIKYDFINEGKLESTEEVFSGFPAHVIQHEMDHLNGILFIDRILEQNSKLYKIEGEDWEEVGI
jgi:peptide deformylase